MSRIQFILVAILLARQTSAASEDVCEIPADEDILGLGVRLGLYFQILSNFVVGIADPDEAAGTFIPSFLFILSYLIAVLYSVINNNYPPGALISSTWYPTLVISLRPNEFGREDSAKLLKHQILTLVLMVATLAFNTWFWFQGLDVPNSAQCMEPRVFFFANLSALGNTRTLFKVLSCFFLILFSGIFIVLVAWIVFVLIPEGRMRSPRILDQSEEEIIPKVLEYQLTMLVIFIVPTELQIYWNHLSDINRIGTTGQIIPLCIGAMSLIRAIYLVIRTRQGYILKFWDDLRSSMCC